MNIITYKSFNEKAEYYMNEIFNNNEDVLILKNGEPFPKFFLYRAITQQIRLKTQLFMKQI